MQLQKRTFSLPADTLERFEKEVPAGQRSSILTELLNQWLDQQQDEQLRREIIEGCREMADVYLAIEREYHPLEEEVQRALDSPPPPRRNRARATRPRRGV
jgi:hypothetical protein